VPHRLRRGFPSATSESPTKWEGGFFNDRRNVAGERQRSSTSSAPFRPDSQTLGLDPNWLTTSFSQGLDGLNFPFADHPLRIRRATSAIRAFLINLTLTLAKDFSR